MRNRHELDALWPAPLVKRRLSDANTGHACMMCVVVCTGRSDRSQRYNLVTACHTASQPGHSLISAAAACVAIHGRLAGRQKHEIAKPPRVHSKGCQFFPVVSNTSAAMSRVASPNVIKPTAFPHRRKRETQPALANFS